MTTKRKYFALYHENDIVVWATDEERRVIFQTEEDAEAFAAGMKYLTFEKFHSIEIRPINLDDYDKYVDMTGYKPFPNGDCLNLIKWREQNECC